MSTIVSLGEAVVSVTADMSQFRSQLKAGGEGAAKTLGGMGAKVGDVGKKLTTGITLPVLGIGAAAIKTFGDFEQSMNVLQAATGASAGDMKKLEDQAKELGASTVFSASDAAEGMVDLGKAGFNTSQTMAAIPEVMNLAATEGMKMGDASGVLTSALAQFGLKATDAKTVVNALAGASNASKSSVAGLGESMKLVGSAAAGIGMNVQDTAATLAVLSDAGLEGSVAGTSLASVLNKLTPTTTKAKNAMKDLNLDFTDAHGNFDDIYTISGKLKTAFKGMSDEQRKIKIGEMFGRDASTIAAVNALIDTNTGKWEKNKKAVRDQTAAEKLAQAQTEGIKGSLEAMSGSLETAGLAIGSVLAPWLTKAADGIGKLADKFTNLSPSMQKFIVGAGLAAAAVGPLLIGLGSLMRNAAALAPLFKPLGSLFTSIVSGVKGLGTASTTTATSTTALGTSSKTAATGATALGTSSATASTGVKKMGTASRVAAGAAGVGMLVGSFASAKSEGASFGNVMTGVVGGALTGFATTLNPIGAIVGGLAGGALPLLAGAFGKAGDEASSFQARMDKSNTAQARAQNAALKDSLDQVTGAYTNASRAAIAKSFIGESGKTAAWVKELQNAGVSMRTITSAVMGQQGAVNQVNAAIGQNTQEYKANQDQIAANEDQIKKLSQQTMTSSGAIDQEVTGRIKKLRDENAALQNRNATISKTSKEFKRAFGDAQQDVQTVRVTSDAVNSLAQRLGVSAKQARAMTAQMSKPMRIKLNEEGLSEVLTDMEGVTRVAADMRKPSNSQIKILLKAANIKPTIENVRKVRQGVLDLKKVKPDMSAAVRAVQQTMKRAQVVSKNGADGVRRNVQEGTRKAKPNLSPFMSGLSKSMKQATSQASKGASNTAKNLRSGTGKAKANLSPFMSSLAKGIGSAKGSASSGGKNIGSNLTRGASSARADLSSLQAQIKVQAAAAGATAAVGGSSIGSSLTSGVRGAINASAGSVAAAAASMVSSAIAAAKAAAKSKSPSKVTYKLGLDIDEGLRLGIVKGSAGVSAAGWQLSTNLIQQIARGTDITKYLGRASSAIAKQYDAATSSNAKRYDSAIASAEKRYNKRSKNIDVLEKRWKKSGKKLTAGEKANLKRRRAYASKLLGGQKKTAAALKRNRDRADAATKRSQDKALAQTQKYFVRVQNTFNKYKDKLTELRTARKDMISGMQESFLGEVDLSNTGGSFQVASASIKRLAGKAKQASQLTKKALAAGIPKGLVQQVLGMGLDSAIPALQALTSGSKGQVKALAADYAAISNYGKQAGTALGNAFYNTGIAAQEGLIRGLLNNKALQRAGTTLAKKLTRSVRKALGIRSPSTVMAAQVGEPAGEGVVVGAEKAISTGVKRINWAGSVTPVAPLTRATTAPAAPQATAPTQPAPVQVGGPQITQVFTGPTTSGGRLKELDWTTRYATKARNERYGGVAR